MAQEWDASGNPIQGSAFPSVPTSSAAQWDASGNPIPVPTPQPQATMQAAPAKSVKDILSDFEADLHTGGARTAAGRMLGQLQGRADAGYSGLNAGVSPGAANILGSPELGITHAIQGAQQIPEHPVSGTLHTIGGALEAATIPSLMVGGPAADAAITAIPSKAYAGKLLGDVADAAHGVPVNASQQTLDAIQKVRDLAATGGVSPKVANQLASRVAGGASSRVGVLQQMQNELNGGATAVREKAPLLYDEARNFYSNLANPSTQEKLALNPTMASAVNKLKSALHGDLTAAADTVGKGEDYANAIKEYAKASQLGDKVTNLGKYGLRTALGAGGLGGIYALYKEATK